MSSGIFNWFYNLLYDRFFPRNIEDDLNLSPPSPKRIKFNSNEFQTNIPFNMTRHDANSRKIPINVISGPSNRQENQGESSNYHDILTPKFTNENIPTEDRLYAKRKLANVTPDKHKLPVNVTTADQSKHSNLLKRPNIQKCYVPSHKPIGSAYGDINIRNDTLCTNGQQCTKYKRDISRSKSLNGEEIFTNLSSAASCSSNSDTNKYRRCKSRHSIASDKPHQTRYPAVRNQVSHISLDSHSSDDDVVIIEDGVSNKKSQSHSDSIPDEYLHPTSALTDEMHKEVNEALSRNMEDVVTQDSKFTITRAELETLRPGQWLSDMIINFYLQLISDRSRRLPNSKLPEVAAVTSFFYPKLVNDGYSSVKRWTRRRSLLSKDLTFIPLHFSNHWALICVDCRYKRIIYYDSLKHSDEQNQYQKALKHIMNFLMAESLDKRFEPLDSSEWKLLRAKNIPHQENNFDCGVFVCMYAEYLSMDESFDFTQNDMSLFRQRIMVEIIRKSLLR